MALYWHPYLAELLRHDYGDRLIVEEEVPLGDMPLKADLLLIKRDPAIALPFPFSCLGARTLMEYKSPDDSAGQEDLAQLEIYGLLDLLREKVIHRGDLTLWLVASHFRKNVSLEGGAQLVGAQEVGPGVTGGMLDGFPTFFIDLNKLPVQPEALPLLMVAKGPHERELVEFLVDHFRQYPKHVGLLRELHLQRLEEVLLMKQLTPEQAQFDEFLWNLLGKERAMQHLAQEEDRERLLEEFIRLVGPEKAREILERMQQKDGENES